MRPPTNRPPETVSSALCINPWIYDFAAYDLWVRPLGLLTIAGALRAGGVSVRLIDCLDRTPDPSEDLPRDRRPRSDEFGCGHYRSEPVTTPSSFRGVPRRFKRYGIATAAFDEQLDELDRPDVVLVTSGMTYWYPGVLDAVSRVRRRWPRVAVLLGGVYAALCPDHAARHSGADRVMGTAGPERVLRALSDLIGTDFSPDDRRTPPAYDLIEHFGAAAVLTGRGCPYWCSYCASGLLEPKFVRFERERVVRTIGQLAERHGVRDVAFYDDALLVGARDHLLPILDGLAERDVRVRFHTPNGLHARFLDGEVARALKDGGFRTVRLSFESADPDRQADSSGKVTTGELADALQALDDAGFATDEVAVYALMGLPGQGEDEVADTLETIRRLGARSYLAQFSPIPGTVDFDRGDHPAPGRFRREPLLHNNTAYPYLSGEGSLGSEQYRRLRDLSHELNREVEAAAGRRGR